MATLPPDIMNFFQRFQALQLQQDTGNELVKDLLLYCERVENGLRHENDRLARELQDAQLDLDDARRSRRDLQTELREMKQTLRQASVDVDNMKNRNPYVMVLIDGDGMIFNEALVRLGIEGGKQAATQLRNTVLEYFPDASDHLEIQAKVCANISGLAKAMCRDGSLDNQEALKDFTLGFTQGKASFDYVDVGHGKERADSKIKECLRWHLRNHNCKQILLGISHDAGYAPFIDEVVTPDDRARITILEGPPAVRELQNTGLTILNFNKLFRAEKLVDRQTTSPAPPNTWAGVTSTAPAVPIPSPIIAKNGTTTAANPVKNGTAPPVRSSPVQNEVSARPSWNPGPRGLDPSLKVDAKVLQRIKQRPSNNKLCNNHYLRGPCIKDECTFEHDHQATDEELKAIAYLARLNPCTNGQDCEAETCIYGHHCPSITMGKDGKTPTCSALYCKFETEDHPPSTIFPKPRSDRGYY
ncbi:uncharacterized protein PAC_15887 [Phialocephala subalpina]|uniref:C3H1-type domain-containing protein n=1 Tax=Phialocephala subalpina TaxID=576137 RepID=A0A1L7XM18_9HELO|nr:uncharacterized protein PAC_15887 [Phialocephala subalpina]